MASLSDLLGGTQISEFLGGYNNNPAYQQAKLQLQNQQPINAAAWAAYNQYLGNVPQQQVAELDPTRMAGLQQQINAATGSGNALGSAGANTSLGVQGGVGTSQNILGQIAQGGITPGFNNQVAQDYLASIMPTLQGQQENLVTKANTAWNKGVGNLGAIGGGALSSGRDAAIGQATENVASSLAGQQQQLAYNAALQAAQAGLSAGQNQYAGQGSAAQTLGQQALTGAQLTPTLQEGLYQPGAVQEAVGTTLQQQRQNELNAQYQNSLLRQQDPFKALSYLQGGLGTLGSTTQASSYNPQNNTLAALGLINQLTGGNAIGSIGNALGIGGGGQQGGGLLNGAADLFKNIFGGAAPGTVGSTSTGGTGGTTGTADDWSSWFNKAYPTDTVSNGSDYYAPQNYNVSYVDDSGMAYDDQGNPVGSIYG